MMFDVWQNVFVMRVRTKQRWFIRMRLRIVPVQLLLTLPDFVTILIYDRRQPMIENSFSNDQADSVIKVHFAHNPRQT